MHRASSVVVVLSVGEGLCSGDSFYLCMELFTTKVVILKKMIYFSPNLDSLYWVTQDHGHDITVVSIQLRTKPFSNIRCNTASLYSIQDT